MRASASGRRMIAATLFSTVSVLGLASSATAAELKVGILEHTGGKGDPFTGPVTTPGIFVWSAMYQQLTRNERDGTSQPFLATSWTNTAPTTWKVDLRRNVLFSNGEQFNADAVVATYNFMWSSEAGKASYAAKNTGALVSAAKKIDDYTVEFTTPQPDPLFAKRIQGISIVAPKAWADIGAAGFVRTPIGTGPYVVTYANDDSASGVKFDKAWKPVTGNVDKISWALLPEGPSRAQALTSKQIDIDVSLARDSIDDVTAKGLKTYSHPSTRTLGISLVSMRNGKPVTDAIGDVRVRQALNYAVNKQAMVDNIFKGSARVATQGATTATFGYNPNIKGYPYDPQKAQQLLAEAGYPNGKGLELEFRAIMTDASQALVYQAAVQDLNRQGIKTTLISQPFADWIKPWIEGTWTWQGVGIGHDLTVTMDAGRTFDTFSSCLKNGGTVQNPKGYYCNPAEHPLIEKAAVEFDAEKRKAMLQESLAILTEKAPIIFLVEVESLMGYNPRITNFKHTHFWIPFEELQVGG